MADPKNINSDPFDHPDGYFEALERNWRKSPERVIHPLWYHGIAASLLLGLGLFALWPREPSAVEITLDDLAYAELSAISEVEFIYALYEHAIEDEESLGEYIDFVEWDAYELLMLEEHVLSELEPISETSVISEDSNKNEPSPDQKII